MTSFGPADARPPGDGAATTRSGGAAPSPGSTRAGWTVSRVGIAITGTVLVLLALALLVVGAAALYVDMAERDSGYVPLDSETLSTDGYALVDPTVVTDEVGTAGDGLLSLLGTARIRATPSSGTGPVFVGIADGASVAAYLRGVAHATVRDTPAGPRYAARDGIAPPSRPGEAGFWTAQASGAGSQVVTAPARDPWTLVVMGADASRPVAVRLDIAASLPALPWIGAGLLVVGAVCLVGGLLLVVVPVRRARG